MAYVVNNARTSQYIDIAATDGSGKLERLAASDFLIPNDWSADGRFLVYMNFQHGLRQSWTFLTFGTIRRTVYGPGAEAQFSPDGKWIAFTGLWVDRAIRSSEVYVGLFPGPGRRIQISNHGGAQARWRADGKELFYITMDKKLMAVAIDTSHDEPVAGVPHAPLPDANHRTAYRPVPICSLPRWQALPDQLDAICRSRSPDGADELTSISFNASL